MEGCFDMTDVSLTFKIVNYTQAIIVSFINTNTYQYDFERTFPDCSAGREQGRVELSVALISLNFNN